MKRTVLFSVLLALVAGIAQADPRWWTHDRLITAGAAGKHRPDVAIIGGQGTSGGGPIVVVWEEESATGAGLDIHMDASFDNGCSWCGPIIWADDGADETRPRLAVGVTPSGLLSIQVIYEVGSTEVRVSGDASIDAFAAPDVLCRDFQALAPPTPVTLDNARRIARPRITAATRLGAFLHFHAVWEREDGGPVTMYMDSDLSGVGTDWGAPIDVGAALGAIGTSPEVASDALASDPSMSAVTLFFTADDGSIRSSRSVDSGATWTFPALQVSAFGNQSLAAADSSSAGFGDTSVWTAAVWQFAAAPHTVSLDAAHWTSPTLRDPDFDLLADEFVSLPPDEPGTGPSISIAPSFGSPSKPETPLFAFWTTDAGPTEIVARGGQLNQAPSPPRDLTEFPFEAIRVAPPDPTVSEVSPHSSCEWHDDWPALLAGSCVVNRVSGSARDVASADGLPFLGGVPAAFVTVFADDRSGTSQIYFKLADGQVSAPSIVDLTVACDDILTARADVTFAPLRACPDVTEWIDRYLLYYGSADSEGATPNGPFVNRLEIANLGLSDPHTVPLTGLNAGEIYHFVLIAEDEARNVSPAGFDPRSNLNVAASAQMRSFVLTPSCRPELRLVDCTVGPDDCAGTSDGRYDPGDTVPVTLTFENSGDWTATGIEGLSEAAGATVTSPPGAVFTIGSIATAASEDAAIELRLDMTCPPAPGEPSVRATGVTSDGGLVDHGSFDCPAAPLVAVECGAPCDAPACLTTDLGALTPLLGRKELPGGTYFEWPIDPDAAEYHLNSVILKGDLDADRPHRPGLGIADEECTTGDTWCIDGDALVRADDLFYQVYSACGLDGAEEGP